MSKAKIENLKSKIIKTKEAMMAVGDMRPGSLTVQSRKAKSKYGEYWQLSYTHKGKGGTHYIPQEFVKQIEGEVLAFKKFKRLYEDLIGLTVEYSQMRLKLAKEGEYDYS